MHNSFIVMKTLLHAASLKVMKGFLSVTEILCAAVFLHKLWRCAVTLLLGSTFAHLTICKAREKARERY